MAYLFLLIAVCCLPPAIALRNTVIKNLQNQQYHMIQQLPGIEIEDGRVTVDQRQPCTITRLDGSPAVIIDTTGSMNYIDDPRVYALLMESALIVRSGEKSFKTFDLSSVEHFYIDRYIAGEWFEALSGAFVPLSYSVFLLCSYGFAVFVMFVTAAMGFILTNAIRGGLSFSSALRIATVAATPSILFITLSATLGIAIPEKIHMAVTLMYFFIGIRSSTRSAELDEEQVDLKSCLHDDVGNLQQAA